MWPRSLYYSKALPADNQATTLGTPGLGLSNHGHHHLIERQILSPKPTESESLRGSHDLTSLPGTLMLTVIGEPLL